MIKLVNTPVDLYVLKGIPVNVKREDLSCPPPGPPFSKVRGIVDHFKKLKKAGVQEVGYTETSISMAGWGVAWICKELKMKAVIFNPTYKNPCETLLYHREQWKKFGAEIIDIPTGMAKVNYYISRNILKERYPKGVMLSLGIPFKETIDATADQVLLTLKGITPRSVIVSVGSGTIAAGVWQGIEASGVLHCTVYGIMCRKGNVHLKEEKMEMRTGLSESGLFRSKTRFELVNPGWEYTEKSKVEAPFPCNPYYDLKAWEWLEENIEALKQPILFWNIGK